MKKYLFLVTLFLVSCGDEEKDQIKNDPYRVYRALYSGGLSEVKEVADPASKVFGE